MFGLSRLAQRHFTHRRIGELYRDVRAYLPRDRFREFRNAWVINNLIRGPRRRRRVERQHHCELPAIVNISPSEACNLHCRGCYATAYEKGQEIEPDQLEKIVAESRRIGIYCIGILGGEPLLKKDLLPFMARHRDVAFRISTNGTVVDDETVSWLKRLGHVVLFFSLEGLATDTDFWRGQGVYGMITENMRRLACERVLFGFSALVHTGNHAILASRQFLDEMASLGNRFGLFFPYGPVGVEQHFDLVLGEAQLGHFFRALDFLQPHYSMLLLHEGRGSGDPDNGPVLEQGCRAGITVHITPRGFVEPCNGIQFSTESVLEKGLLGTLCSPFYRDVSRCVKKNHGRCIAIYEPEQVLSLVSQHAAQPTNAAALPCFVRYSDFRRGRDS